MQDEGNILSHEEKRPLELRGSIFGIYAESFRDASSFILFLEFEIEIKTWKSSKCLEGDHLQIT